MIANADVLIRFFLLLLLQLNDTNLNFLILTAYFKLGLLDLIHSLKNLRSTTLFGKDIEIRKLPSLPRMKLESYVFTRLLGRQPHKERNIKIIFMFDALCILLISNLFKHSYLKMHWEDLGRQFLVPKWTWTIFWA